jgi:hypothetical protein
MSKWISFSLNVKMNGGALPAELAAPHQRSCGVTSSVLSRPRPKDGVLIHGQRPRLSAAGIRSHGHARTEKSFRNWTQMS